MKRTNIEWTDLSSNPVQFRDATGKVVWACVKHSSGCANCYSEALALRFNRGGPFTRATMEGLTPFLDEKELKHILTAKTIGGKAVAGSRCFLGDMTDVFGEWVPDALLDRLFAVMALRGDVTFQVLTKRADRMAAYMQRLSRGIGPLEDAARALGFTFKFAHEGRTLSLLPWPIPNLWLGVSVEHQAAADERIPHLLRTPAAVRFLSCEPLLGPVGLQDRGWLERADDGTGIDWVIVGGESGPGARPMAVEWARDLVRQCKGAGVPVFCKQLGSNYTDAANGVCGRGTAWPLDVLPNGPTRRLVDAKGGDIAEFPADLRVREFPEVR